MDPFVRDETHDYGLAPDESFEPTAEEEPFDLQQPHISTLLGPITPEDLGVAVLIAPNATEPPRWLRNPAQTLAALEDAYNAGLRGVVFLDQLESDQQQHDLAWIAGRSPIHLVLRSALSDYDRLSVDQSGSLLDDPGGFESLDRVLLTLAPEPRSWAEAMERAPLALMERGFNAQTVRNMLIDNPAAALTIEPSTVEQE